jgi:hypothetical protein
MIHVSRPGVRVWTNAKFCSPTRPSWHSRERLIYEVTKMLCMNARKMNVAIGQDLLGMQVVELGKDSCGRSMRSAPPRSLSALCSRRRGPVWGEGTCRCLELALGHAHGGQMVLPSALRRPPACGQRQLGAREPHSFERVRRLCSSPPPKRSSTPVLASEPGTSDETPPSPPSPFSHRLHAACAL